MKPQVGDIVQVKEEHWPTVGLHVGLVTRLIIWPHGLVDIDCVVFLDPNLVNPVQLQTRFVEVISAVPRA
jgi:hypothetical protein